MKLLSKFIFTLSIGAIMITIGSCKKLPPTHSTPITEPNPPYGSAPTTTAPLTYNQTITFAGSGAIGEVNGLGINASFKRPAAIAADVAGNVYVADGENIGVIRKITPDGLVSILAGSSMNGSANGTGTLASFSYIYGLAVDLSGNIYVADAGNNMIRKVTPAGVVTTLAGNGTVGSQNGTGTAASFNFPCGVAVDEVGYIYVSDSGNGLIRKISPAGLVTTLAGNIGLNTGNGRGTSVGFDHPFGIAVDRFGNVYVADHENNLIRKITFSGIVSTLVGSGPPGEVVGITILQRFNAPQGISVDVNGNIYVADTINEQIKRITPDGTVMIVAGSGAEGSQNGAVASSSFDMPYGVTVDKSYNVYVIDYNTNLVREINPNR